jgi:hypothetical protein
MNDKPILFILVYNCENEIIKTLNKTLDYINFFEEVCVIDNNSQDNSYLKIKNFIREKNLPSVKIIKNKSNFGQGGSHKIAFEYSTRNKYKHCFIYHGDDQANLKDIKNIIQDKEYLNFDCILGARFLKESKLINYAFYRTLGNLFFNYIYSIIAKKKIYDLGSGINIYNNLVFEDDLVYYLDNNMGFNYQNLLLIIKKKLKYLFQPISWKSEGEKSNVRIFSQSIMVIKIALLYYLDKSYHLNLKKKYLPSILTESTLYSLNEEKKINWKFRV